jgi:hypothetical protein
MKAEHGDNADNTTERQQHQAPSSHAGRQPPIVLTSQVNLIKLQRHLKPHWKVTFSSVTPKKKKRPELSRNKWRIF